MKDVTLTRKDLYDLVWSEPVSTILKKYILTDPEFRKICADMDIPLPKSGHWQKVKAGKSVSIGILSNDYKGEIEIKLSQREEGEEDTVALSPMEALQKEIENDPKLPLTVPQKLTNPDKLVATAKESLTKNESHYSGWTYSSNGGLTIHVTIANIGRALLFMDAFIKLLKARGHNVTVDNEGTYAIVENEKLKVRLREKNKRVLVKGKYSWDSAEYHPTGILILGISEVSWREIEWKDGRVLLEEQLSKILAKLEMESKRIKEERIEKEKRWAEQRERDRIKQELEKRKQKELSDFKALLMNAHRWSQSMMMSSYIDSIEADALLNNSLSDELKDWISWARKKVDWYNPQIQTQDELLDDNDKEKLIPKPNNSTSSYDHSYFESGHSYFSGFPYWKK